MTEKTQTVLEEPEYERRQMGRVLFFGGVLAFAFFLMDHSLDASDYFEESASGQSLNRTADRLDKVSPISAQGRIGLGLFGLICMLATPPILRSRRIVASMLLALWAYFCVSIAWSTDPGITIRKCAVLVFFGMAAYGIGSRLTLNELVMSLTVMSLAFIGIGVIAEIRLGNFIPLDSEYRFVGTCHPNMMSAYGAFCCLAALVFTTRGEKTSLATIIVFSIGFTVVLATKSRTALAGLLLALAALRLITLKRENVLILFVGVGVTILFGLLTIPFLSSQGLTALGEAASLGRTDDVTSLTGRLPLWEELITFIDKKPLMGYGYLAFWNGERVETMSDIFHWEIPHGHNMYLDLMLDGGVVAVILYASILITGMYFAYRRYEVLGDKGSATAFALVSMVFVHGMSESLFKMPIALGFLVISLLLKTDEIASDEPNSEKSLA